MYVDESFYVGAFICGIVVLSLIAAFRWNSRKATAKGDTKPIYKVFFVLIILIGIIAFLTGIAN